MKSMDRMTKRELLELAAEAGVEVPEEAANAELAALIAAAGPQGAAPEDGPAEMEEAPEVEAPEEAVDDEEEPWEVRVDVPLLNVRSSPAMEDGNVAGQVPGETILVAVGKEDGWLELDDGRFVMAEFTKRA